MRPLASVAEMFDVVFLHDNEKGIYGDIPRRCLDIVDSVGSPNLRLVFDPANYVQCGVRPFDEAFAMGPTASRVRTYEGCRDGER